MQRILIDTDPGVDDALALLMALAHPGVRVEAITLAAGNVGITSTARNALKLLELAGADVPVHAGAGRALVHVEADAAFVHGRDGFGDTGYRAPLTLLADEPAASAMIRLSHAYSGAIQFVTLGPLTNLALALSLDPSLPQRVPRLVIMGGAATGRGNHTHLPAEFNVNFDPEAAAIVCQRWPQFELVDWETTLAHGLDYASIERWLAAPSHTARFYRAISRKTRAFMRRVGLERWYGADALAMAVALEPDGALEWAARPLAIATEPGVARGATLVDWDRRMGWRENARILRRYDGERFARLVRMALRAP
jgi:purine nucleosidase